MDYTVTKFIKTSTLIARICEDFTNSDNCTIKESQNFTELIFSWNSGEIINYRILKSFYDANLKSIFEENYKKSLFFKLT